MNHQSSLYKRIRNALPLLLLPVLVSPSVYASEDGKVYPGTFCKPANVNNPDALYTFRSTIANTSETNQLSINCPLIKDMIGGGWSKVLISYSNPHTSQRIHCNMNTRNHFGDLMSSARNISYLGKAFDLMRIYAPDRDEDAVYTINCILPPAMSNRIEGRSSINMIQFFEKD